MANIYPKINTKRWLTKGKHSYPAVVKCVQSRYKGPEKRLSVLFEGFLEGRVQVVLVVDSILGTVGHKVDDTESKDVNALLESFEDGSDGPGVRSQAQEAVLLNESIQKSLVGLDELLKD